MKKGRRRIEIVPLWREPLDAQLFAQAIVEIARQRLETRRRQAEREPEDKGGD